jgi:hypothetical protein
MMQLEVCTHQPFLYTAFNFIVTNPMTSYKCDQIPNQLDPTTNTTTTINTTTVLPPDFFKTSTTAAATTAAGCTSYYSGLVGPIPCSYNVRQDVERKVTTGFENLERYYGTSNLFMR